MWQITLESESVSWQDPLRVRLDPVGIGINPLNDRGMRAEEVSERMPPNNCHPYGVPFGSVAATPAISPYRPLGFSESHAHARARLVTLVG